MAFSPLIKAPMEAIDLAKGGEIQVNSILTTLMFATTRTGGAHGTKTMCVINQQTEIKLFLEFHDLFQLALIAAHTKNAFRDDQNAPGVPSTSSVALRIWVSKFSISLWRKTKLTLVQSHSVNDAGMAFCVIDNDIMTTTYTVNGTHDTLVTVVKQESVFLLHKSTQF